MSSRSNPRRSFLVRIASGLAGLWVLATSGGTAGCDRGRFAEPDKYGGVPPPDPPEPVTAKYGGPDMFPPEPPPVPSAPVRPENPGAAGLPSSGSGPGMPSTLPPVNPGRKYGGPARNP